MSSLAFPRPDVAGRAVYGMLGAIAAVGAVLVFSPWVLALWIAPDLALVGAFAGDEGRLKPRAVPVYNAVHALPVPVLVAAAGLVLGSGVVAGLGLIWVSHCLLDRAMGFGLRAADGSQRA